MYPDYKADWSEANQNNQKEALRAINIYAKNFGVLYLSNTGASGAQENGNNLCDIFLFNNLLYYPAGQTFYGGNSPMIDKGVTLEAALTCFNGGTAPTVQDNRKRLWMT